MTISKSLNRPRLQNFAIVVKFCQIWSHLEPRYNWLNFVESGPGLLPIWLSSEEDQGGFADPKRSGNRFVLRLAGGGPPGVASGRH